jgi:ankyrin repeat protein
MAQYTDNQEYAPNSGGGVPNAASSYVDDGAGISLLGLSRPYYTATGDGSAMGPDRLFAILEEAVPRPDANLLLTAEDLQRRREVVEQAWDQVRRWLWAHESQEERAAAAYIRGQADVTPLHLMCKLNNPPTEIISDIVEAGPEVVSWVDSHGWLPLHHACANGASTAVLQILTSAYPESKTTQDNQNRTPLHFYATRNADNPIAMATNVELLSDTGASELSDRGGMLPMHYACAYGTNPTVLKVLANSYPESLLAKENKGRTPMHLSMVNAHRDASPGVLSFLLETEGSKTVNMRDYEGNLPLHLLNLGVKGLSLVDEPDKLSNVAECLKLYLAAQPSASPDFLAALQDLPDSLQDVAVVSPHVRTILNKKIIQRFPTSILILDGYMLLFIIICFEKATTIHINLRFQDPDSLDYPDASDVLAALRFLYCGASYFLARELMQVVGLWSFGNLTSWFYDTTNWLDMAVIVMVIYFTTLMLRGPDSGLGNDEFRTGCAVTKGVLWLAVIYYCKSLQVDFAVFFGGVVYVVHRLGAFLLAVGVILFAFAQMFFIVYRQEPVCTTENNDNCEFPHCTFESSLLKVSSGNCVRELIIMQTKQLTFCFIKGVHNDDGRNWFRNEIRRQRRRTVPIHPLCFLGRHSSQ